MKCNSVLFGDCSLWNMATRRELSLEEKINLIKEKEQGVSHRELCDKLNT